MLRRWGIRMLFSLAGVAVGIFLSALFLNGFSADIGAFVRAAIVFWIVHLFVQFFALRVLIRQPSIALAGLLALASTVVALIVVNIVISGITVRGFSTYVFATLIIWLSTSIGDYFGRRKIRQRRADRPAEARPD